MASETKDILDAIQASNEKFYEAIEKQSDRFTSSADKQTTEIRGLAQSITGLVTEMKAVGAPMKQQSNWQLFVGIAGLVAALMSPLYFHVQSVAGDIDTHKKTEGHPKMLEKNAALTQRLHEFEGKFGVLQSAIVRIRDKMDIDDARERHDAGLMSRHDERLNNLERHLPMRVQNEILQNPAASPPFDSP